MDALDQQLASLEARIAALEAQLEGRRRLLTTLAAEKADADAAVQFLRDRLEVERQTHQPLIDRYRLWAQKREKTTAP